MKEALIYLGLEVAAIILILGVVYHEEIIEYFRGSSDDTAEYEDGDHPCPWSG